MTNKKLKLAAMSVALTACVAAQPMAAHAVAGPDSVEDNAAESSTPAPVAEEGEKQEEAGEQEEFVPPVNDEAKKDDQAPAFGPGTETDDIIIDYKPAEKPDEPGKSGEDGETDGSEGSGETDETENPDGTYVKGDVIDNSKKDEATGKDGKIGTATKEETPDSSSSTTVVDPDAEVKKGDPVVGKDEDGNTTITTPTETTGTETTTTTGTGKADSSTTITDTKKGEEIDLNEELGEVRPDWKTDKDATLGDYTVKEVEPSEDGNSKTLTLKKTSPTEEKEMSAEDVAKLLDVPEDGVEKKTDDEGNTTYTLKKEETSTDENGNTVTRTTYYEITGNSVKTRTETTLKLKVEKGTVDVDDKDLTTEIKLPSIAAKNTDETKTDVIEISSEKLGEMLKDKYYNNDTGEYVYTETDANGKEYTYKVKKTEDTKQLTNKQLADRLGKGFTADDNGVYYNGEKLTFDQMDAVRKTLSYTVEVTEVTKAPGQEIGKDEAEAAAKTEAIKDALRNAAKQNGIELTEDELKGIKLTGGDLIVTRDSKKYTFHYTKAGVKYSAPTATGDTTVDGKEAEDVKETTVTGTAYVTNGTISWSKPGESGTYTASGTLKPGDNHIASKPTIPEGAVESTNANGDRVYTVTTKNPDGSTTETIYTFRKAFVSIGSPEERQAAWEALAVSTGKSIDQLKAEGYTITGIKFDTVTKTSWTVETRTRKTEKTNESLNQKILKAEGDPTWTLKDNTLTVNGKDIYENLKKNADGTYTATQKDGDKTITYTFTLGEDKSLDDDTIKAMLAKEFPESNGQITLDTTANTATYKDGETTVTIDYSNLSKKTLKIDKSVSEAVSVTETIKDGDKAALEAAQEKLYQELKKKVESIKLQKGEELWIGDLQIIDIENQKQDIIEKFTTAVSHENMSQQALIAALNAQADEAKNQTVVVNKGTKYEEKLDNYYSGEKENFEHTPAKPPKYYELAERDDIRHLDLASGAKMDKLPGKDGKVTTTDCVLLAKNQKLEWNYDANDLVTGNGNTTVGLQDYISKDKEDGKGNYHYEYDRLDGKNNNPEKSAFYKLTGTVAYDALKNDDGSITEFSGWFAQEYAINAYREATGKTKKDISDAEILGTYVVPITTGSKTIYQVYTKTAEMTSYGYMTRDANTCVNSTFGRQYDSWDNPERYKRWDYIGGYDLMISDLVQVSEGKVVGQTQSSIKTLWAPLAIRSTQSLENKSLQLNTKHTSTPVTKTENLGSGYQEEGSFTYDVSYEHTDTYTDNCNKGVQGTGTGKYKTFTLLVKNMFSGKGETSYDEGKVSYTHRTTDKVNTTPVSKETVTTTDAHVDYNYTSIETRKVTVSGEETVIVPPVDPDTPDGPVEDETPDEVVTPETPELPAVQDAAPDEVVLPAEPELPAVQDATALPQTGVNWFTALGMAFSGMLLTIVGAFTSLKYKEKH